MQPPHQHSRINLSELKAQMVKKIGLEGSKQYFYYMSRFLSFKLSKPEFNKVCLRVLGRENIPLHNQFICSILRNTFSGKAPSPAGQKNDDLKHSNQVSGSEISADGYQQNGVHTSSNQTSSSPGLSNGGDMLPVSPRKARTGSRDRRTGDRRSALAPNSKTSLTPQLSGASHLNDNVVLENGDINSSDSGRQLQLHEVHIQQAPNKNDSSISHLVKTFVQRSPDGSIHHVLEQAALVSRNDGKEASARSPLRAPLGLPFCPISIGGARKAPPPASGSKCVGTSSNGALLDSHSLRERMEQIAVAQGLEGVSVDCANLLNHGLDSYMKQLIRSSIEIVGAKSGPGLTENAVHKHQQPYMKLINGVRPGHQYQIQNCGKTLETQEHKNRALVSLQDFRVAMEINPSQLGEDWPLLLEKICTRAFEE